MLQPRYGGNNYEEIATADEAPPDVRKPDMTVGLGLQGPSKQGNPILLVLNKFSLLYTGMVLRCCVIGGLRVVDSGGRIHDRLGQPQ